MGTRSEAAALTTDENILVGRKNISVGEKIIFRDNHGKVE